MVTRLLFEVNYKFITGASLLALANLYISACVWLYTRSHCNLTMFLRILDNFICIWFRTFRLQGRRAKRCDQGKHQRSGVGSESEGTAFHNIALSFSSSLCIFHALWRSGTNYIHRRTNQNSVSCEDKVVQFQRRRNKTFQEHEFPLQISLNLIWSQKPLTRGSRSDQPPALGFWQGLSRHQSILRPISE